MNFCTPPLVFEQCVIEPDTLPQCFQFQEWIGHGVVSIVSNA